MIKIADGTCFSIPKSMASKLHVIERTRIRFRSMRLKTISVSARFAEESGVNSASTILRTVKDRKDHHLVPALHIDVDTVDNHIGVAGQPPFARALDNSFLT